MAMPVGFSVAVTATAIVFAAASAALAADNERTSNTLADARGARGSMRNVDTVTPSGKDDLAVQIARLPWPAPVGHRQPRASEVATTQLSPSDTEQRQQDEELDRKLLICRGC
jgi:hypothetical protein